MTTTYATAQDVVNYLRLVDPSTGARINVDLLPSGFDMTKAEIEDLINMAEDQVDQECRHAWRTVTVSGELHDYRDPAVLGVFVTDDTVCLDHFQVRGLSHALGDKLELWQGSAWLDVVDPANGITEGIGPSDGFWVDQAAGIVHLGSQRPSVMKGSIRATYRYGETAVHSNIRKAVILLAAIDVLGNDRFKVALPEGPTLTVGMGTSKLREMADRLLAPFRPARV